MARLGKRERQLRRLAFPQEVKRCNLSVDKSVDVGYYRSSNVYDGRKAVRFRDPKGNCFKKGY